MIFPRRRFLHLAADAATLPAISRIASTQTYSRRFIAECLGFVAIAAAQQCARPMTAGITLRSTLLIAAISAGLLVLALAPSAGAPRDRGAPGTTHQKNLPDQRVGKTQAPSDGREIGPRRPKEAIASKNKAAKKAGAAQVCRTKQVARDQICDNGNRLLKDVKSCKNRSNDLYVVCIKRI